MNFDIRGNIFFCLIFLEFIKEKVMEKRGFGLWSFYFFGVKVKYYFVVSRLFFDIIGLALC